MSRILLSNYHDYTKLSGKNHCQDFCIARTCVYTELSQQERLRWLRKGVKELTRHLL